MTTFKKLARDLDLESDRIPSFSRVTVAMKVFKESDSEETSQLECNFSTRDCAPLPSRAKSELVRSSKNSAGLVYRGIGFPSASKYGLIDETGPL